MCPSICGQARKLQTRMTIRRANGARKAPPGAKQRPTSRETRGLSSSTAGEDFHQLLWRNHLELTVSTVAWFLIRTPSSKMRHMTEAGALHVLIRDFDHQFGPQRLPR